MAKVEPFILQPGGLFREAKDGGLIVPVHIDASRATDFLAYWRIEGITFAALPLLDGGQKAPTERQEAKEQAKEQEGDHVARVRGPAERLHASGVLKQEPFWAFCEEEFGALNVVDEQAAHDAVKVWYGLESLAELTEDQRSDLQSRFLQWKRENPDPEEGR